MLHETQTDGAMIFVREIEDYYDPEETERRARAIVRAAAKTLPIPLKAIPKKRGGLRKLKKPKRQT